MKKYIISTLLCFTTLAKADVKTFLDNAVIEIENPATVQTNTHNVYFGGGFHMRVPRTNFQPFQVVAPSVKAGCGGIDITFGAFSYFNKEYLVDFLKKMVAQAPAIAFWTAVQTLCPQCKQLQAELTKLANQINSLNFDSCETSQKLGGTIGSWFGTTLNRALDIGTTGPDWLKSLNEAISDTTTFINTTFTNTMTSAGCNPSLRSCYLHFLNSSQTSLLDYSLETNTYFASDTGFKNIVRALTGDIKKLGTSGENKLKLIYIAPSAAGGEIENIIKGLMGLESNCGVWTYSNALSSDGSTISASTNTICSFVKNKVDDIITKIENRQPLSNDDLQFLSMFRIPVYKIFNTLSMQPGALEAVKYELIKMLTAELTYEVLSAIFSDYNHIGSKLLNASQDKYLPIDPENLRLIRKNQANVLRIAHRMVVETREDFEKQLQHNFAIERLRAMMMASLARHPIMSSRLFTQSLLGFGK